MYTSRLRTPVYQKLEALRWKRTENERAQAEADLPSLPPSLSSPSRPTGRSGICYEIVERMMSLGCSSAIVGREFVLFFSSFFARLWSMHLELIIRSSAASSPSSLSAKGLAESAAALTASTSQASLSCPADVRDPKALVKAVEECIKRLGKIDFVICGSSLLCLPSPSFRRCQATR